MRKAIFAVAVVALLGVGSVAVARPDGGWFKENDGPERVGVLDGVLGELVTDGIITQDQADAITAALDEKKEEMAEARRQAKEQLETFWEDGVLTSEEIAQLPFADRFLEADGVAEALEDGQITKEEMRELRHGKKSGAGLSKGPRRGR